MRTNSLVPQRVAVVLNPIKLQADEARDAVILACRKGGWSDPEFYLTEVDDSGYSMARRAVEDGADVVLAAGGDGTVRAVAETLAGTDTALGLVPLGTGNLLARNLGANLADPRQCVDVALFGSESSIDTVSFNVEFWDATESQIDGDSLGKITAFESEVFPSSLRVRVAPSMADLDEPEAPVINAADPDKI